MKVKEIKITDEGYEVTFLWTTEELKRFEGVDVSWFLKPNIALLRLLDRALAERESKGSE